MFGHGKSIALAESPAIQAEGMGFKAGLLAGIVGLSLMVLAAGTAGAGESAWDGIPSKKAPPLPTEGLTEQDHANLDKVFVKPGVNLASYGKVILAPMDTAIERRFDEVLVSVRERDHAFEYMEKQLKDTLGSALVTAPGPGVLKLSITFTDYVPNRSFHAEKARGGGTVDRVYAVGRAAFQATLTDSQTGQIVAVIADADMGLPFPDNINAYTIYGDADRFSRRWAKQIAKLVTGDAAS
ncbi:DUF3313 family protein [Niveispirillum sp. KHB5.9]|uniref:DUF3313 family protein n=1 Tax=Niveispirillum sp. KHB5.9 TaxID=3400269 RepID=UPI003A84B941